MVQPAPKRAKLKTDTDRVDEDPSSVEGVADEVVEVAKAIGDRLRARILRALREESYSVSELCQLFDVPQPALSHHLKVLHLAGLVAKRREGNSIFYRRYAEPGDRLRQALFSSVDEISLSAEQISASADVHQQRRDRSNAFFAENAHRFADQQALISEADVYVSIIVDMMRHAGTQSRKATGPALEIGPGSGQLLEALARDFDQVVGIDSSASMLVQTARRVGDLTNVELWQKDFTELPAIRRYQAVIAAMVLHHLASPQGFFHHAARVIKRDGLLVIAELCRHEQQWVTEACGDQWLGFETPELHEWARRAGFSVLESQYLAQKNGFRLQIHSYLPIQD